MITQTRKYTVSFPASRGVKRAKGRAFYDLARNHVLKGKRGGPRDLSKRIDEVAYGG